MLTQRIQALPDGQKLPEEQQVLHNDILGFGTYFYEEEEDSNAAQGVSDDENSDSPISALLSRGDVQRMCDFGKPKWICGVGLLDMAFPLLFLAWIYFFDVNLKTGNEKYLSQRLASIASHITITALGVKAATGFIMAGAVFVAYNDSTLICYIRWYLFLSFTFLIGVSFLYLLSLILTYGNGTMDDYDFKRLGSDLLFLLVRLPDALALHRCVRRYKERLAMMTQDVGEYQKMLLRRGNFLRGLPRQGNRHHQQDEEDVHSFPLTLRKETRSEIEIE